MRVLVLGQSGQLAQALEQRALRAGASLTVVGREAVDLGNPLLAKPSLARLMRGVDAVINASAYTAVDRAEDEPEAARALNAEAPGMVAEIAAAAGLPFVHVSTDYVFDGSGDRPWRPDDAPAPLGVYGQTKRDGESAVAAAGGAHAVVRTSWVFSETGSNFVKTMLRLGAERPLLRVVDDQVGGPTYAGGLADGLFVIARALRASPDLSGTYHLSGAPDLSWADFAAEIMRRAQLPCEIEPIASSDYPTPAARPLNSRLDCTSTETAFGVARPDWRRGLDRVIDAMADAPVVASHP